MNLANSVAIHNLLTEAYYTSNTTQTLLLGQSPEDTHHALYRLISHRLSHSVIMTTAKQIEETYLMLRNQCAHSKSVVLVDYNLSSLGIRFKGMDLRGWKVFVDLTPEFRPAHAIPQVMNAINKHVIPAVPDKVFVVG